MVGGVERDVGLILWEDTYSNLVACLRPNMQPAVKKISISINKC